jgi:hypothetical protein
MIDDMRVVFESRNRRACADRALVLASVEIPHQVISDLSGCALIVPAEFSARAIEELRLYEDENPPPRPVQATPFPYQDAVPGIIAYVATIIVLKTGLRPEGLTVCWYVPANGGAQLRHSRCIQVYDTWRVTSYLARSSVSWPVACSARESPG